MRRYAAALALLLAGPATSHAYVTGGVAGLRWPNASIDWYYNPQNQPDGFDTATVEALLQRAAEKWHNGCALRLRYRGRTDALTYTRDNLNVIGWQSDFGSKGESYSWHSALLLKEADIRLNRDRISDPATLEGLVAHELGHALGLAHSDRPASILFANPYHTSTYEKALKPDDLAGCAALYGSSGSAALVRYADNGVPTLNPGESASVAVTDSEPAGSNLTSLTTLSDTLPQVWFSLRFSGFATGQTVRLDLVAPDGTLYETLSWANQGRSGSHWFFYYWSKMGAAYLPGTWNLYFYAGEVLKARRQFNAGSSYPASRPAETALLAQPAGNGAYRFSVVNLTPARTLAATTWTFDDDGPYDGTQQNATLTPATTHTVRLASRSSLARYSGQGDGADALLSQTLQLDAGGAILGPTFTATRSGPRQGLSIQGSVAIPAADAGQHNIYVVARIGDALYVKTADTWSAFQGDAQPLLSVTAPAMVTFNLVDLLDVSTLPAGTEIYLGYGANFAEVLRKGSYAKVFTLD